MSNLHYQLKEALTTSRILQQSLASVERECREAHAYTAVVGGIALERCVTGKARKYLKHVVTEDLDIVFAVRARLKGASNDAVMRRIRRVDKVRNAFLMDLVARVQSWLEERGAGDAMRVHVDKSLSEVPAIKWARIVSVITVDASGVKRNLVDTKILDQVMVDKVKNSVLGVKSLTGSRDIVPYNVVDGVRYATCQFVYYDTVRMLTERLQYFVEKRSLYALLKLYRHVVKFMALYVMREHVEGLPAGMKRLYGQITNRLRQVDVVGMGITNKQFHDIKHDETYVKRVRDMFRNLVSVSRIEDVLNHFRMVRGQDEDVRIFLDNNRKTFEEKV